jgi:ABC-type transport system substrate-binding protein
MALVIWGCGSSGPEGEPNEMVLHHILIARIKGLDPGQIRDVYSMMVAGQIFETLYDYHFLKRPYELIPLLAEDMPQVSEDGLVYTIRIKKGVRFQDDVCFSTTWCPQRDFDKSFDGELRTVEPLRMVSKVEPVGGKRRKASPSGGRELKAEDFVFSIKRIANIKYLSPSWSLFDDRIVGLDEFREYTKAPDRNIRGEGDVDYSQAVEGLIASDDYTLVIKLKKPWPQMVASILADISTAPVAKEAVDYYSKDIVSHPVGTGPFKLNVWRRGSYIELVRNPTFRGELYPSEGEAGDAKAGYLEDAGKPIPFADRVVWTMIEERQPAWLLFLQGKVDATVVPKDNYGEVMMENGQLTAKMRQLNIQLKSFEDPSTYWLGFNMADDVVGKNKPLRLAINRAIDREKFIELFFNNRHLVAHGFIPPMMGCYNPQIKQKGYARYDPDEAKRLLKEAEGIFLRQAQDGEQSRTNGEKLPTLKITIPGVDTWARQYGQFLTRQLNAVGLEVELQYMDLPTYQQKVNNKSVQIFAGGVTANTPDELDFLSLFYSRYAAGGPNKFNYCNPEFDRLYEKVEVMRDCLERRELCRRMEVMVLEDCPAAFLNHRVADVLHHDWYKNYKPHSFAYGLSKYRRIDLSRRAAYKELLNSCR